MSGLSGQLHLSSCATANGATNCSSYGYNGANDGCLTYSYDGFGRVAQATAAQGAPGCGGVSGASYTYDALDRRVKQTDATPNTTTIHYDGLSQNNVAVESSTTSGTVSFELDAAGTAQGLASSQGVQYLTGDGQGDITTATGNTTAAVTCAVRYDAFGAPINATAANPCNAGSTLDELLFKGTRHDPDTGQYQFGSRVYDPTKATFLTPDTYRTGTPTTNPSVGVDPLTANTYVGLNGDPVNLSDPSGHRYTTGDDYTDANSGVLCQTCYTYPSHYPSGTSPLEIVGDRAMAVHHDAAVGSYLDSLDARANFYAMHAYNESRHQFDGDPYDVGFFSSCHLEAGIDVCPNSQGEYALPGEALVLQRLKPLNLPDLAVSAGAVIGFAACSAGTGFIGTVACGAAAAAADSAARQYVDTGTVNPGQVGVSALIGGATVFSFGAASAAANRLWSIYTAEGVADGEAVLRGTNIPGQVTSRGGFRVGTVRAAWENAEEGATAATRLCPTCGDEMTVEPGTGPRDWDINHDPPWSQRTFPPDVTRQEVLDNYQDDTWLECPSCNRSRGAG